MSRTTILAASLAVAALALSTGNASAVGKLYRCDDLATRAEKTALNSKVYQGDEGWFFRDSDLNAFYMYSPQTLDFLQRLRDVLKARGVTLALMPLPPKSVLEPTHSAAATADGDVMFDPTFAREQFAGLVTALRAAGLATADVLAAVDADSGAVPGDYFFARDIHWRPRLADVSARAVASLLLGVDPTIGGSKTFTTVDTGAAMNESNTNAIFGQLCADPVPPESFEVYRTEQADQSATDFLGDGDAAPPVDLIGTSFTDEAKPYNFTGFLRQALSSDVAAYSMSGGGVDTALYKWAHEGRAARDGLKALIWELPYPERLEAVSVPLERQVVPAIVGACAGTANELGKVDYAVANEQAATLSLPATLAVHGNGYYVAATLSDGAAASFTLSFDYRDGRQDILPLIRPDRVSALSSLFGEVSPDIDADLAGITLTNRSGLAVSGTLSFCQYPAGLWQADTTTTGKASS